MKKLRKIAIFLLVVSSVVLAAFLIYERLTMDGRPPEISVPSEVLEAGVQVTEQELLEGVTAWDDHSGDVTAALVVEKLGTIDENNQRVITYAAIDESGNVGRARRILQYTDYEAPRFSITRPLRRNMAHWLSDMLNGISAYSVLDGDLTGNIKFQKVDNTNLTDGASVPVELRVTDSAGNTVSLTVRAEMYDGRDMGVCPELSQYLVYIPMGEKFRPENYLRPNANCPESEVKIDSQVNVDVPGVYTVEYRAESDRGYGATQLIVVVESE